MYTGNTLILFCLIMHNAVYPCVYREHTSNAVFFSYILGLSLCIQGTPVFIYWSLFLSRFIPVYTGNTSSSVSVELGVTVYPCVYREHKYSSITRARQIGLSLCIQGTPQKRFFMTDDERFIPVYTGNTFITVFIFPFPNGLSLCIQGTP